MKGKIKIGILLKDRNLQLWEYRILEKLFNSEFAELVLIIETNIDSVSNNKNNFSAFYRFHDKLDKYLYKNRFDYDKTIDCSTLTRGVPVISYDIPKDKFQNHETNETSKTLSNYNLDIILNFASVFLNGYFLEVARYGILYFYAGDQRAVTGAPPCYWEIVKKIPEIGCAVKMAQKDSNNETILYRTSVSTFSNSININRNRIYGLAVLLIPRIIEGVFNNGVSYLDRLRNKFDNIEISDTKFYEPPTSFQAFLNIVLILMDSFYKKLFYLKNENWFLLFKINKTNKPFPATLHNFNRLAAPIGKYWADPFVIKNDGHFYIFIEEYLFEKGKGHISLLKLDNNNTLLNSEVIIEKSYHMSYPFIFYLKGKYYMVPETKATKTIQLYTCSHFPDKWEFTMNLMENINATDSTLFFHDNKWWLFTSIDELKQPEINYNELFLYYSDDLFSGHWQSHPGNPIVTEINNSRSAGKILIYNNKIFRPSQDCSGGYGRAINLNQITKLTVSEYEEVHVRRVEPKWDKRLAGMHTINFDQDAIVLDACMLRKRF